MRDWQGCTLLHGTRRLLFAGGIVACGFAARGFTPVPGRLISVSAESRLSTGQASLAAKTQDRTPDKIAATRVRFVNVAQDRGVAFEHFDPVTERQYISETIGSGAAWIDGDADGWLDLVLLNSAPMPGERAPQSPPRSGFFRNRGDGSFEESSDVTWRCDPGFGQGCAVGDVDNDGFDDLYVTYYLGPNRLFHNNGDGTFSEIAARAASDGTARSHREHGETAAVRGKWSTSCAWGDLDRDGDLDLYVCNYLDMPLGDEYPFCGDKRRNIRTVCSPGKFPGLPDDVFENLGDGTFRDSSDAWGFRKSEDSLPQSGAGVPASDGRGLGVVIADLDGDGLVDVYVANDLSPNLFYRNSGGGRFREEGLIAGCALSADGKAQAGMGVDAGDIDGDGRPDIFVTNFFREPNSLFQNQGGGRFREISARSGLGRPSFLKLGFGCGFFDADNDGRLDVFVANGHIDRNPEAHGTPEPYRQPAQLFLGDGRGRFVGITDAAAGSYWQEPHVGRAAAFGDFDNDGRMDIAVNHNGEHAALLHNEPPHERPATGSGLRFFGIGRDRASLAINAPLRPIPKNRRPDPSVVEDTAGQGERENAGHWLRLVLVGTTNNRSAVGTRVTVVADDRTQVLELAGGRSYLSAHDPRLLVGVGSARRIARLEIRWPNGKIKERTDVPADRTMIFRE